MSDVEKKTVPDKGLLNRKRPVRNVETNFVVHECLSVGFCFLFRCCSSTCQAKVTGEIIGKSSNHTIKNKKSII